MMIFQSKKLFLQPFYMDGYVYGKIIIIRG